MKNLPIILLLILAALWSSCASRSRVSNAAFGKYISGFTSGKVDPDEEIRVELSQAVLDSAHIDRKDSALLEKAMRISPSVEGKFYWKNEKTIAFKPTGKFREGKEYHVALKLNRFTKVPYDFKTFDFYFETDKQKFEVSESGFSPYDTYNIEWQQYEMLVRTNTAPDLEQLKQCFEAISGGKKLKIRCQAENTRQYRIIVDSIERKDKAGSLEIHWNAKQIGCDEKGSRKVNISSLGSYQVLKMDVLDDGDQKLNITFSDPVLPGQHFDGLIEVEDASKIQFSATGNVVSLFFTERLEGTKKVTINKGLLNFRGYKMDSATSGTVEFRGPKPALRMQGKGCILPNSQGLLFPFESIGIHTVDVRIIKIREQNMHQFLQVNELDGYDELTRVGKILIEKTIKVIADTITPQNQWSTHILDLGKLIQPEPGSLYRVCIRFKKAYTYLACKDAKEEEDSEYIYDVAPVEPEKGTDWSESGWHGEGFDGYDTWRYDDDDPCEDRYYRGGSISKNILASDIGVIYQEEKNKTARIVTTNLLNAQPLSHTEVTLYSYTQEKITSGITDEQGFLQVSLSQKPFLLVAKKDKQRAYLKLTNANCLSTSKFDVEGTDQGNGFKGFLYAERGVWRPGDSVFLHFVLNDRSNPLPEKHPVTFELSDPDGKPIFKRTVTENQGHIYPLYFQTSGNAPMGSYTAKVTIGNAVFTKNILLEYIVPNRMKLLSQVSDKLLSVKDSLIDLRVTWLNGATGKGLKVQTSVSLIPDWNFFKKYEDYRFIAPYNETFRGQFDLKEAVTNDSGLAFFHHPGMQVPNAPGMLSVSYVFKAYEQGGGFSIDKTESNLSVFDSYVGIRPPSGTQYSGALDFSKSYAFAYVVVDKDQKKTEGHHLQLKIYEMQYQHWYEADDNDIYSFRTHSARICVRDTQWIASTGEGNFNFGNIGKKYGRYMVILKDLASGHETGAVVVFDDPGWDRYGNEDADYESIVQLTASKKSYTVGEKVEINVPAADNANILIHIESDAKVLQQFWVKGNNSHKPIEFTATSDMGPGIYIHATVLQPHHYTKDGSPIRQYGILPLKIEDPATRLIPLIHIADEIRPETPTTIGISEQSGKEMNYSLVLVDEGLLDLTHFKTPDIWQEMNAQQSLKIKTWDMFNQVIGAYSGKIQNVFTIGGDGSYDESEDTKANRFRPAIINLGVFHLNRGQKQQHTFSVPNYCGRMKAFVIAYQDGQSGSSAKTFYVRKPLMLLTAAPRMMSAAEQYHIPITVFNMDKKSKKVNVTMSITGLSGYAYHTTQSVSFKTEGDEVVYFDLKIPEETGILRMNLTASDGAEKAKEDIEIQVKPTQPAINHQRRITVEPGATQVFDITAKGMKSTYTATLDLSDILNFDFQNRLNYLIQYPHGCVEQTTSSAFAQLFLNEVQDLTEADAAKIKIHVESVIKRLNQYQTYNGGFAYWPYQNDVNEYASVYVLHFMNEAQRKGFEIPKYIWDNALTYQKEQARKYEPGSNTQTDAYEDKELTQAYRLYLLAGMNLADISAMNKLKESGLQSDLSKALLAKAYKLIAQNEASRQLVGSLSRKTTASSASTALGSELRDKSMTLLALQNIDNTLSCQKLADEISASLITGWNSTLATSMALVALSRYYTLEGPSAKHYAINEHDNTLSKHTQSIKLNSKAMKGSIRFKNVSGHKMYLSLNEYYASTDVHVPLVRNGMQLKVSYLDMNNAVLNEADLAHGTNFIARIQVSNTTGTELQHVALEYYIANGWQVISNRYIDDQTSNRNSSYDFKDVKDERMNLFFNLSSKETKTFYVQLNASYKGRFFLPLVQCYPMYNEQYKAQHAGKWVTVK